MNTIQRLYEIMRERNLSLNKLANLSGIKYSTLQMAVKRGGQLSIDTIERICAGLDIPLVSFFDVEQVQKANDTVKIVADKPLTSDEIKELRLLLTERHKEK